MNKGKKELRGSRNALTVVLGYKYTVKTRDFHWRFPFNKNSGLKFQKFHVPNGKVHSGCTDPSQATARLVIVLCKQDTDEWYWGQQFCQIASNGEGHFGLTTFAIVIN